MNGAESIEKLDELERAVAEARRALNMCDAVDCIDWLATVQLKTAELAASLMPRIQNRPY